MSGQSLTDRITAAQHSVTGSAVSKTVCKATTHEVMGPKKKHLDWTQGEFQNLLIKLATNKLHSIRFVEMPSFYTLTELLVPSY
ncbi:UNVERIFIED_CONTAM: hypothetical protein K2H54_069219 [Gekko kuhli]